MYNVARCRDFRTSHDACRSAQLFGHGIDFSINSNPAFVESGYNLDCMRNTLDRVTVSDKRQLGFTQVAFRLIAAATA